MIPHDPGPHLNAGAVLVVEGHVAAAPVGAQQPCTVGLATLWATPLAHANASALPVAWGLVGSVLWVRA